MKSILLLLPLVLASCSTVVIERADGTRIAHAMLGTNADRVVISAEGVVYEGINQSDGLRIVGQTTSTVTGIYQAARVAMNETTQGATTYRAAISGQTERHAATEATTQLRETEATKRLFID
jgi:hypothetical protein